MDNSINNNIDKIGKKSVKRLEEIILFVIALVGLLSLVLYWR